MPLFDWEDIERRVGGNMGRPNYGWDHDKWLEYQRRLARSWTEFGDESTEDRTKIIQDQIDKLVAKKMAKEPDVLQEAKWPDMQHVHLKGVPELMLPYRNKLIVFTDISVAAVTVDELLGRHAKKAK